MMHMAIIYLSIFAVAASACEDVSLNLDLCKLVSFKLSFSTPSVCVDVPLNSTWFVCELLFLNVTFSVCELEFFIVFVNLHCVCIATCLTFGCILVVLFAGFGCKIVVCTLSDLSVNLQLSLPIFFFNGGFIVTSLALVTL